MLTKKFPQTKFQKNDFVRIYSVPKFWDTGIPMDLKRFMIFQFFEGTAHRHIGWEPQIRVLGILFIPSYFSGSLGCVGPNNIHVGPFIFTRKLFYFWSKSTFCAFWRHNWGYINILYIIFLLPRDDFLTQIIFLDFLALEGLYWL